MMLLWLSSMDTLSNVNRRTSGINADPFTNLGIDSLVAMASLKVMFEAGYQLL